MLGIAALTPLAAIASTCPAIVALALLALVCIIALLWRSEAPPFLLLPVLFQWSEVAILPIATIWRQTSLNSASLYGADLETSAVYGLLGVTALATGGWLGVFRGSDSAFNARLRAETLAFSKLQMMTVGLGAMLLGYVLGYTSGFAGPARELFGNAAGIKYLGIFVIAYWCLLNRKLYWLLAAVAGFDILIGMTGFFADFKGTILVLVVAVMGARPRLRLSDIAFALMAGLCVLSVATFWTAIKIDYRDMVNKGTGAQVVLVPLSDRVDFITNALQTLDGNDYVKAFDGLVSRHGYIDYLALVLEAVPRSIPHENGEITLNLLAHITMPRILFPDKPPLPSDTDVMKKYTGLQEQWDENTSISIGNLGELYVDFGWYGGLIAEIMIGAIVGYTYRLIRDYPRCPALLSAGLCTMIVLQLAYFGEAYIKLLGSFIFTALIAIIAQRFIIPPLIARSRLPFAQTIQMRS